MEAWNQRHSLCCQHTLTMQPNHVFKKGGAGAGTCPEGMSQWGKGGREWEGRGGKKEEFKVAQQTDRIEWFQEYKKAAQAGRYVGRGREAGRQENRPFLSQMPNMWGRWCMAGVCEPSHLSQKCKAAAACLKLPACLPVLLNVKLVLGVSRIEQIPCHHQPTSLSSSLSTTTQLPYNVSVHKGEGGVLQASPRCGEAGWWSPGEPHPPPTTHPKAQINVCVHLAAAQHKIAKMLLLHAMHVL